MLAAQNIDACIGRKRLLNNFSLSVKPGEIVAVVGPNGAGKSTFVKILCGELKPNGGAVLMNGRELSSWRPLDAARIRGVLPQNSALAFHFSVFEVVLMGRSPHRKTHTRAENEAIAHHALALTDTDDLSKRMYTTLSGGECQRVHLARVLAQIWQPSAGQSRYLLLDEPTSALDIAHQHSVLAIAKRFAYHHGAGVLAILHDLNLAALYADRIAVMHHGSLIAADSPFNVLRSDLIQQIFGYPVTINAHPLYPNCPLLIPHIKQANGADSWGIVSAAGQASPGYDGYQSVLTGASNLGDGE